MTISLQTGIVYGPVKSRRFGASLGINLLPVDSKICTMSCVYCQYRDTRLDGYERFPEVDEIAQEIESHLQRNQDPDWIMLSGNGEPTLYPEFEEAVDSLIALRDRLAPSVRIGILSNSTTCWQPQIRRALLKLDARFMKLDAGHAQAFYRVNRPLPSLTLSGIIEGLRQLPNVTIQSLFLRGNNDNTDPESVESWIRAVQSVSPRSVQIYTVERPAQCRGVLPVSEEKLRFIASTFKSRTGIPCDVF